MAAMGYSKILSFIFKIIADSQIRWFGKRDMCTQNVILKLYTLMNIIQLF